MLKIKDDVDLKELEKFGLVESHNYFTKFNEYDVDVLTISKDDKLIELFSDDTAVEILFDLIQAGLVEKVGDE